MSKRLSAYLMATASAMTLALSATAGSVNFYTDRAAFLNDLAYSAPVTNIDFEGIASPGSYAFLDGVTISGVLFNDWWAYLLAIDSAYSPAYYDWNSGATAVSYYYDDPVQATLPAGITAVGADVMVAEYYAGGIAAQMTATITLADSSTETRTITTLARPNRAFMGFIATQSIQKIEFVAPGSDDDAGYWPMPVVDNLAYTTFIPPPPQGMLINLR